MRHCLLALLSLVAAVGAPSPVARADHAASAHAIDWTYEGDHGPKHWAELAPDFGECGRGRSQSPIDISHATARDDLPELRVAYHTAPLRIVNTGHMVQVNTPPDDHLHVGDHVYDLMQFHFHAPSEEHVDGRTYDMEIHLVHRDAEGHLAVLGVLVAAGRAHPALDHVLPNMPSGPSPEHTVDDQIDPATLMPGDLSYFYYEGSLTTPPCAEHVAWYVLEAPIDASAEQIAQFHKLYRHNARPVQPLKARPVYEHRALPARH